MVQARSTRISREQEVLNLAAQWLWVRQWVIHNGPLPYGMDLAGVMLGLRDLGMEIEEIIKEMKNEK